MAQLIIRNLDESIKQNLKKRASRHGISMEAEARLILTNALKRPASSIRVGSKIASRFAGQGLEEPLHELHQAVVPMKL